MFDDREVALLVEHSVGAQQQRSSRLVNEETANRIAKQLGHSSKNERSTSARGFQQRFLAALRSGESGQVSG